MVQVALVEPQIPPNTGNIARFCAAMDIPLHLVHPLGFSTDDKMLKRAGLDYWPHIKLQHHRTLKSFYETFPDARFYYLTTKSSQPYTDAKFNEGDFLVFGSETKGLPETLLEENKNYALTVPMKGPIRSLNLATTVSMVVGEALRQLGRF